MAGRTRKAPARNPTCSNGSCSGGARRRGGGEGGAVGSAGSALTAGGFAAVPVGGGVFGVAEACALAWAPARSRARREESWTGRSGGGALPADAGVPPSGSGSFGSRLGARLALDFDLRRGEETNPVFPAPEAMP